LVLSVLRSALAETTLEERLDDPYLLALTREAAGGEGHDDAFDFARAFLLRSERTRARPAVVVPDWRGAVWAVLGHPVPQAQLVVDVGRRWVLTGEALEGVRRYDEDDLALAPPIASLLVGRTDRLIEITPPPPATPARTGRSGEPLPWTVALAEWSHRQAQSGVPAEGGPPPASTSTSTTNAALGGRLLLAPGTRQPAIDWPGLDRTLSGLWRGLRHAAGGRAVVELSAGRHLVPLGGGVCAEIAAHRAPESDGDAPARGGFRTFVGEDGIVDACPPAQEQRDGWIGAGIGSRLPRGLWIRGAGIVLDIKLVQALWL